MMTCRICRKPVPVVLPPDDNPFRVHLERIARHTIVHTSCLERRNYCLLANEIEAKREAMCASWEAICPEEHRKELDPTKRGYNNSRLEAVLRWQYGEIGLRLVGPSHRCKTRFMFAALRKHFMEGRTVGAWTHTDLRHELSALGSADSSRLAKFILALGKLDILLVDDLGKGRVTPASEEAFFALVDLRSRECRPMMFTMNMGMNELKNRFSEDIREPLCNRIETKTTLIEFK